MAQGNFLICYKKVRGHEGGWSNHPKDNGGKTNFGVTQATYNRYRKDKKLPSEKVRWIKPHEVEDIYKIYFWDPVKAEELPFGLDYFMFDYAINSGPRKPIKHLQEVLGLNADGILGARTLIAANEYPNKERLISLLAAKRLSFLRNLDDWRFFGRGWSRRVEEAKSAAQIMSKVKNGQETKPKAEG